MEEIKNYKHTLFRDSQNRVTKEYITDRNGRRVCFYYEYDKNGNIIKETSECGNYKAIALSGYDSEGKWIWYKEELYNAESLYCSRCYQTLFDSQGRKSKDITIHTDSDGTYSINSDYEYDSSGNVVKNEITFASGRKQVYCKSYDADGKLTKKICTYANSDVTTSDYFYDNDGNEIKRVVERSNGKKYIYQSYYENGRKTRQCTFLPDGEMLDESEFSYDENDRLIKKIRKNQNGETVIYKYAYNISGYEVMDYSYDYKNRIKSETVWLAGANIQTSYKYTQNGSCIKINYPDGCLETIENEYKCGKLMKEIYMFSGVQKIIYENYFDEYGKEIKKELTFGDKKVSFVRSYDKDGILRLETFCDDKGREAITHYSYNSNDDIIEEFFNKDNACCYVDLSEGLFPGMR